MAVDQARWPTALDLLGRRWALRLVWELRRDALAFSELRERTGISPSVLSARLARARRRPASSSGTGRRRYRLTGRRPRAGPDPLRAQPLGRSAAGDILASVSSPELSVVCRSCGSEVSPYVTECPYCGTRLRKRAPKLERHGDELAPRESRRSAGAASAPSGASAGRGAGSWSARASGPTR